MAAIDPPATATAAPRPHGRFRALFDELWKDKPGFIGFSVIVLIILCAIFAPLIAPYDPAAQSVVARLKPPVWAAKGSWEHLLGTDQLGRDILSRLIYGAQISLSVGMVSVGVMHFTNPAFFEAIVPPMLGDARLLVSVSGVFEVLVDKAID